MSAEALGQGCSKKIGRFSACATLLLFSVAGIGCGGGSSTVAVTITPTTATVKLQATQQFTTTVTGNSDTDVTWSVNSVTGGNATVGTVTTQGLYTAPANALNSSSVSVTRNLAMRELLLSNHNPWREGEPTWLNLSIEDCQATSALSILGFRVAMHKNSCFI